MVVKHINNAVIVSDTHVGCRLGLCHPKGAEMDDGGLYMPSELQNKVYKWWDKFWKVWVPKVTNGEPYCIIINGDSLDGQHHRSVTQWSQNIEDQRRHFVKIMRPIVAKARGGYYHIRGTEAHVGASGQNEENVAKDLEAIPNAEGQHARWDLWKRIGGKRGGLIHVLHHIGTTGTSAYESTAVTKELVESFVEAGRWKDEPPRGIVRSHRHRAYEIRQEGADGIFFGLVTPGWQLKTPFVYKIPGGRQSQPQIGGAVVRYHKLDDELYVRQYVMRIERPAAE